MQFRVKKDKALEALIFLIGKANEDGYRPSQYDLVKSIFLADKAHMSKYGRPITFDSYAAMKHGPVPSFCYDLVKPSFNWKTIGEEAAPWTSVSEGSANRFIRLHREANLRKLSVTDQEELGAALSVVRSLSFDQLKRLTHDDPAYIDAWKGDTSTSYPIRMELMVDCFEEMSEEEREDLEYIAQVA